MVFPFDEFSGLLSTCLRTIQDGFHFRMGVGPVYYHVLFRASYIAVQVPFSDTLHEVFRHTPYVSIDPIGFTLGIQRKILNFDVLILFTKIFT